MIKIVDDEALEMLTITKDDKVVFNGNYLDIHIDGYYLKQFLEKLDLEVELENIDTDD